MDVLSGYPQAPPGNPRQAGDYALREPRQRRVRRRAGRGIFPPPVRPPAFGRDAEEERRDGHYQEVGDSQSEEGLRHARAAGAHNVDALQLRHNHCGDIGSASHHYLDKLPSCLCETASLLGNQRHGVGWPQVLRGFVEDFNQEFLERGADYRAAAESHYCHPGCHAPPVGEPA